METNLTRSLTPEERELKRKLTELSELEIEMVERELELATIKAELRVFEERYFRIVGVCFADLDGIEAQIADAELKLNPNDTTLSKKAKRAHSKAQESTEATGLFSEETKERFVPSERIKNLFREIARCIHPDLTTDKNERAKRNQLMAEANCAWEEGNESKLQEILEEWKNSPESVKGEGPAAELIRVIRKIDQIEKRLRAIKAEIEYTKNSEQYQLKLKVEASENEGQNLLADMASHLKDEIVKANERLAQLNEKKYEK